MLNLQNKVEKFPADLVMPAIAACYVDKDISRIVESSLLIQIVQHSVKE